jgi:glycosyltransferase involved in cell wall biosynthesis
LDQDYPRLEYIVVDGGSTDGSLDIIHKYTDKLAWWVSEKDSGQAEAINKGLSRARGEIVAWLNSDDTYLPGAISAAVRAFEENPDVVLVYGNMLAVDENNETINILRYDQLNLEDLLCFQIIGQPAVFFRRDALEKAGYLDASYHFLLDHHLWLRIAFTGAYPPRGPNLGSGALPC